MLGPRAPILVVLACSWLVSFAPALRGQGKPPAQADQATVQSLERLTETIKDPERRARLVEQLEALLAVAKAGQAEKPKTGPSFVHAVSARFGEMSREVSKSAVQLLEQVQKLPEQVRGFWNRLRNPTERGAILSDAGRMGGVAIVALLVGALVGFLLRRPRAALGAVEERLTRLGRVWRLLLRLLLDAVHAAAFLAVAFAGMFVVPGTASGRGIALAIVAAVAFNRLARAVVAAVLAPQAAGLRLPPFDDQESTSIAGSLTRLFAFAIYGYFFIEAVRAMGGDPQLIGPLRIFYGLVLLFSAIIVVLRLRQEVKPLLARAASGEPAPDEDVDDAPGPEERLPAPVRSLLFSTLGLWWVAAIFYLVGVYLVWVVGAEDGFHRVVVATVVTAVALVAAGVLIAACRWLLSRLAARVQKLAAGLPELSKRIPRYVAGIMLAVKITIFVLAISIALESWGVDALQALSSPAAQDFLTAVFEILLILLLAAATIDAATVLTESYLETKKRKKRMTGKVQTLVPLVRKAIRAVVTVVAAIMILGHLGVDIGPLLAGVGVLGLAVGFGAQTLVKDIITGVLILVEDSISVGDVVSLDGTGGLVEAINVRSIQLRDLSGNVHVIPYSSVTKVTNMTKEYSRWVIEAGVAYREDVDEVISVLEELGAEMQKDPQFGPDILEPIEILGLDRFEDSAVVVRARLKTKPIKQWGIGREFNRRMKKAFDARGIEIPFPHRTIYLGEDKNGDAPPLWIRRHQQAAEARARDE